MTTLAEEIRGIQLRTELMEAVRVFKGNNMKNRKETIEQLNSQLNDRKI
jgi:hypothetical protein